MSEYLSNIKAVFDFAASPKTNRLSRPAQIISPAIVHWRATGEAIRNANNSDIRPIFDNRFVNQGTRFLGPTTFLTTWIMLGELGSGSSFEENVWIAGATLLSGVIAGASSYNNFDNASQVVRNRILSDRLL